MSSLQKFHRRTNGGAAAPWEPTAIGDGDATKGFWLGGAVFNALIVAPLSTEAKSVEWGGRSYVLRGTTSTSNGLANTNTLAGFGSSVTYGHPAAYNAKYLTTGGYNTWYLPAKDELNTMYSNKSATPFATNNMFATYNQAYWSSTEAAGSIEYAFQQNFVTGVINPNGYYRNASNAARAIRRYKFPSAVIGSGDATNGFWLGTAGDGVSKLIVAPKSTEVKVTWGSTNTVRGTTSTTNGLANTNTLAGFGETAHPAAYAAKILTTGGYNTWYLPAKDELMTMYSNKSATPFATADAFVNNYYWPSTEIDGHDAVTTRLTDGFASYNGKYSPAYVRAVRRL